MKKQLGTEVSSFLDSLSAPPPVSLRINPRKPPDLHFSDKVLWCEDGFYLDQRPSFTLDPAYHGGAYYVQDASSMFLQKIVGEINPQTKIRKALDLCAAPG